MLFPEGISFLEGCNHQGRAVELKPWSPISQVNVLLFGTFLIIIVVTTVTEPIRKIHLILVTAL